MDVSSTSTRDRNLMPVRYKEGVVPLFNGMICDVCGKEDLVGIGDFVLRYTFGYGSLIDGDSVEAAVCDICLEKIIRESIPNAQWTKHN